MYGIDNTEFSVTRPNFLSWLVNTIMCLSQEAVRKPENCIYPEENSYLENESTDFWTQGDYDIKG